MKLQRFSVSHYKSLTDVKVDLHPNVTVIVGPNSVGKSNFVDAMRFLRDACADELDHAMVSRGGITRIRQQTPGGRPFNIAFSVRTKQYFVDDTPEDASYELEITNIKGGEFKVEREKATSFIDDYFPGDSEQGERWNAISNSFSRDREGVVLDLSFPKPTSSNFKYDDRLVLGTGAPDHFGLPFGYQLDQYFASWRFTTLYPTTLRDLKTPDSENSLREDGSNWATIVRASRKTAKGRQNLERINEMMRQVLPDFQDVSVSTVGSYLVPKFKFGDPETKLGQREFDPVQLSDGTLRIYGLLLSLYQMPPPTVLVIEEPEQTVHPGVLAMLAEAFKEVSEQTQIIVTTHSPQLVDQFDPENIRVVTMTNGETKISPIKKSQQDAVQRGLIGLGEFMAAEGIYPELAA